MCINRRRLTQQLDWTNLKASVHIMCVDVFLVLFGSHAVAMVTQALISFCTSTDFSLNCLIKPPKRASVVCDPVNILDKIRSPTEKRVTVTSVARIEQHLDNLIMSCNPADESVRKTRGGLQIPSLQLSHLIIFLES